MSQKRSPWAAVANAPGWLRLAAFAGLVAVGWQLPGWLKPLPFAVALAAFFWILPPLRRGIATGTDAAVRVLHSLHRRIARHRPTLWHGAAVVIAVITLGLGIWKAAPTWGFLATSSLREDETLNVEQYTSRNFARTVSSYDRARNHMLYNVINSVIPGGDSTWPPRARALSILSTAAGIFLIVFYSALRGWFIPAALVAAWLFMNQLLLRSLLEARGYGLLFLIAMASCISLSEWLRTRRDFWLGALVALTVAGAYTLPFYLVFGGGLLLALFVRSPSRQTFSAGVLAAACLALLYLPLAASLARVALDYGRDYAASSTNNFASLAALSEILQFLIPYGLISLGTPWVPGLLALALLAVLSRKWIPSWQRDSIGLTLFATLAVVCFFFFVASVPMRSATFLAAPLAFLAVSPAGGWLSARPLGAWRAPLAAAASLAALALVATTQLHEPLIPRQDWRTIGRVIERALPPATNVWIDPDYNEVLQWNRPGRPESAGGKLSPNRFLKPNFAAVDAQIHDWAANRRPGWNDFPEGIRFVTFPLLRNFQRLFFLPPPDRGIESVTWNDQPVAHQSPGTQLPDLTLLARSGGNHSTDPLVATPPSSTPATPVSLQGPGVLILTPSPHHAPFCNLLFSPALRTTGSLIEWEDALGRWRPADDILHAGEFLSVPVPPSARRIRIRVPAGSPPFALLEAWMAPAPLGDIQD